LTVDKSVGRSGGWGIDSDNNSRKDNWAPDRTVEERSIRNDPDKPGRLVAVDNGDSDHDGMADYADMKHLNKFVRMELDISKVAMAMDRNQAKVRFEYSGSDPLKMGPDNVPAAGVMRIWTKDGVVERDRRSVADGGDYVPGGVDMAAERLFRDGAVNIPLHIEGISPEYSSGIKVYFLPRVGYPAPE